METMVKSLDEVPLTMSVDFAARVIGISHGLAWQMVADGRLPTIRFGRKRLVTKDALTVLLRDGAPGGNAP